MIGINEAPELTGTKAVLSGGNEDEIYTIKTADLLEGFTDRDGDLLSVTDLQANNGTLTNNEDGTYSFAPAANFNGVVSISYYVDDNNGFKLFSTNEFTLNAVNDAPVESETVNTLNPGKEDNTYILTNTQLLRSFSDVDGDTLTVDSINATNATVADLGDGEWKITPDADFFGTIDLSFQVSDGTVSVAAINSIDIESINDAPTATFTTAQNAAEDDTVLNGQLTATDVDNSDAEIAYKLIGAPIDGLSIAADGSWEFDPTHASYQTLTNGEVLELTVNYSVTDSDGASDQAAFTLTLTGTNDAPKLTGLQSSLPGGSEDNPYAITKNQLLAGFSDADDGESLTLDISDLVATDDNGASVGSFELNSTDTGWTFTPNANFNGKVNLSYKVTDGIDSTDAANSFNLAAVNDVPALTGVKASLTAGTEDTAYTIATSDLLTGYTDADTGETETLAILVFLLPTASLPRSLTPITTPSLRTLTSTVKSR